MIQDTGPVIKKPVFANVAIALFAVTAGANAPNDPVGVLSVIDGDTVGVGGIRARLFGIDAPEMGQGCTDAAMSARHRAIA